MKSDMEAGVRMKLLATILALVLAQAFSSELQPTSIEVVRVEDDMIVSWSSVVESYYEECLALYQFTYKVNGEEIINKFLEETEITVPFTACAEKTFVVAPRCRTGAVVAESSLKTYTTSMHECECKPLNLVVEIIPPSTITLSWDLTSCPLAYNITQFVNGEHLASSVVPHPITRFGLRWFYCSQYIVTIASIPRATGHSITETIHFNTRFQESMAVENLRFGKVDDSLTASWSRPSYTDICDVSYVVTLQVNDVTIYKATTNEKLYNFGNLELPPCATVVLIVTPFDTAGFGESVTTTFVTSRGNAGAIRDLNVSNGRIEWTETQDNGECKVVYSVIIREENGAEDTHTTSDAFFENNFVTCSMYNIFIISRIGEDTISTLLTSHRSRPSEVREVDDIALRQVKEELVVSWSPVVIGACESKYAVRHYINNILIYSVITTNIEHTLATEFCAENLVTVQPIVDMIMGDQTPIQLISASAEPNPIENLRVVKDDLALEVTWTGVELGHCPISYIVEHFVNKELLSVETVTGLSATLVRLSCSSNEIRVTTVAGDSVGSPTSEFLDVALQSLDPVADLKVTEGEGALLVTWSPIVEGICNIHYRVTNFDGETEHTIETTDSAVVIEKTTCATNKVTVYGFEINSLIRSEDSIFAIDIDIDLTKVRNMVFKRSSPNVIDVSWNNPADAYHCEISYIVAIRSEDNIVEIRTDETYASIEVDITPCESFEVVVTPISPGGVKGIPVSVQDVMHLFYVAPVTNIQSQYGLISWERPANAGICKLEYLIHVSGERPSEPLRTTSTEIFVNMEPCAAYVVTIEAIDISTGLISDISDSILAIGEPRFLEQISNLEHKLNRESLSISWSPANVGACKLLYLVEYQIDGILNEYSTEDTTAVLKTTSCSLNEITITPILTETPVLGDSLQESIVVEIDEIKSVQNVQALNNVLLTWEAPDYAGNCVLEYLVEIFENAESDPVFTRSTTDLGIEFEFVPCANYIAIITPSYNDRLGVPEQVSIIGETVAHTAPEHLKTVPSLASAIITLIADKISKNSCPIDEARIICHGSNDESLDRTIQLKDNPDRVFEFTLADLTPDTHYECRVQWLPAQSEFSAPFAFLTMEIPTKDLEISNVTSNQITVSWEVPAGLGRYILQFYMVITTVGPNHFVQESCDIERNYIRYVELPPNVFTYTFTEALPNFKYHFSLITRYSIGIDSTAELAVVNTYPAVPGPITDLSVGFSMEECAPYAGDGAFVWSPPCDINGDLSEFKVTLSTLYRVGGEDFIHTTQSSLLPDSADDDYNFSVKIPTLNPFFVYSVAVETVAAYPGNEPAGLLDVIPPAAYSYCSV